MTILALGTCLIIVATAQNQVAREPSRFVRLVFLGLLG